MHRGDAEAEEASVYGAEGFLRGGIIEKILVDVGAQLGAGVHERAAGDGADLVDDRGGQAGVEDGVADGASGAEKQDFHGKKSLHEFVAGRGRAAGKVLLTMPVKPIVMVQWSTGTHVEDWSKQLSGIAAKPLPEVKVKVVPVKN